MMLKVMRINGESLSPEYQDGDYVLVASSWRKLSPGDVIVFRNEKYGTMIKRLIATFAAGNSCFVMGSHPRSNDSRHFGAVPREDVIGKVIWHIHK
jgi:signal peptidase I